MNKQSVLLSLSFVTMASLAGQAGGCLSSATATNDAGTSSSSSGGGSGGSSGSTSGSSSGGGTCIPADPTAVIDDMSGSLGTINATGGYWYTYSDRTVPNSEPPILLPGAMAPAGSITPAEGQSFPVSPNAASINGCQWSYRESTGGGEATWGAGFGMDFLSYPPDGGQVPFNQCDAGNIFNVNDTDSGTVGIVQPYDASKWTGISFWGISFTGKNQTVFIHMDDDRTSGWGGVCNACNATGGTVMPCSDSFSKSVIFTPTWTQFQISFTDPLFKPENWSKNNVMVPVHSNKLYNLHFQVTQHPAPPFDLGVAMVTFYK